MKVLRIFVSLVFIVLLSSAPFASVKNLSEKIKISAVGSYHREYAWAQETNEGFCDAMLKSGHFDNKSQIMTYMANDWVEVLKTVIKKEWTDSNF